jgi:hypothetical protein
MIQKTIGILMFFLTLQVTAQEGNWELEKDKNGIKVWTRKMPDSKLKEYKGSVVLNTTVEKLVSMFRNTNYHDKLFFKCRPRSVVVVKKISDNDFYTYMIINAPVVKDRDVVTHYSISAPDASGAVTVSLEGAANLVPAKEEFVRVSKMKGFWKFVPQGNGKVLVVHQAYSSPGGSVPEGLANSASVDAPFDMLSDLKLLTGN